MRGVMLPDNRAPLDTITIPTTQEQDQAIQSFIDSRIGNPGTYNLYDNNCATTVQDALHAGGVNTQPTNLPKVLMQNLHHQYPGR